MDEIIIYNNLDGSCGIIYPAVKTSLTIEEIAQKDVPAGLSYRITTKDSLPSDRYFRNAWTDAKSSGSVDIDLEKAKSIHMQKIRETRDQKFIELGFPYKLEPALEQAIIPQEIRSKLETLRAIPQQLDFSNIKNVEALKAIWPQELK